MAPVVSADCDLDAARQAASELFDSMQTAVLRHTRPFDDAELASCDDEADISFSELPEPAERRLRRHVFLPPPEDAAKALEPTFLVTRSLSATIVAGGFVHYLYRDTTAFPTLGPLFHRTVAAPSL
jgi:hypothetical protein